MLDQPNPMVWIKAFWGFDPANDGYLGFTREADRTRLLEQYKDDHVVLIYGADSPKTAVEQRHQALGFLKLENLPIRDTDKISKLGLERKVNNGWADRWTYALPVRRAWKVNTHKIDIRYIAASTYRPELGRVLASRGELLSLAESATALKLPVEEVNVFGEPPIVSSVAAETPLIEFFTPSRGVTPSFGVRSAAYIDGIHFLYMLQMDGDITSIVGASTGVAKKALVKVGLSNDPKQRCADLNSALPPAGKLKWRIVHISKPFPNGITAKSAEDELKSEFAKKFRSMGGEFFFGDQGSLETAFAFATRDTAFYLKV